MQINQFIMICLIVIAMVAVAIFMLDIASNLLEWIMSIATIIFTAIFTIIVSIALFIANVVIGVLSCVVFVIGGLIVYLKKKIIQSLIKNIVLHQQAIENRKIKKRLKIKNELTKRKRGWLYINKRAKKQKHDKEERQKKMSSAFYIKECFYFEFLLKNL